MDDKSSMVDHMIQGVLNFRMELFEAVFQDPKFFHLGGGRRVVVVIVVPTVEDDAIAAAAADDDEDEVAKGERVENPPFNVDDVIADIPDPTSPDDIPPIFFVVVIIFDVHGIDTSEENNTLGGSTFIGLV
uniref:Uncharacterized protein n=1 Tax=Panagrolaimus superbus TaxID=310955 RepID=A0A914XU31_9BILA